MLFNSLGFLGLFLPLTLLAYGITTRIRPSLTLHVLCLASLVFYGVWSLTYLALLVTSIAANYLWAFAIARSKYPKRVLLAGVGGNLALLGYYKYAGLLAASVGWSVSGIVLPLAISFYTFQQVAYLVDVYRGLPVERRFDKYLLFVLFFPQLIAGPIVRYQNVAAQFDTLQPFQANRLAVGVSIFFVGLAKKVLLADSLGSYADLAFNAASDGQVLTFIEAWGGALAYAGQIYFDFAGYSDMAVGMGEMFGVRLPINFNSPYRSTSLIEFWRRWNMTLSSFLRDYLYIPLGGNRRGPMLRYLNLLVTMALGGLWHGAGWTFLAWGVFHGLFLAANHAWQRVPLRLPPPQGWALTMTAVVTAWVLFRADSFGAAWSIWQSMMGLHGAHLHPLPYYVGWNQTLWLAGAASMALLPNVYQVMGANIGFTGQQAWFRWRPNVAWALGAGLLGTIAILVVIVQVKANAFIYFQF